jgi:breast cancer 2 susceptibility protein
MCASNVFNYLPPLVNWKTMNVSKKMCINFGVHDTTICLNSVNATRLRFDPCSGLPIFFLGDHCSGKGIGSLDHIRKSLAKYGVQTEKLSNRWFQNHSRWIIWKLASIERKFPTIAAGKVLTYPKLIVKLKQRYDKEVIGGMRSPLRRILNRDVSSLVPLVLCVSHVFQERLERTCKSKSMRKGLEVTDGWYSMRAILDESLNHKVEKSVIKPGSKIFICNTILNGNRDGLDPLDNSYDSDCSASMVYLKLCANSTRLASWNSRLGFVIPTNRNLHRKKMHCKLLTDIIPEGGNIPCIDLLVYRVYPVLYLERQKDVKGNILLSRVQTEVEEHTRCILMEERKYKVSEVLTNSILNENQEVSRLFPLF